MRRPDAFNGEEGGTNLRATQKLFSLLSSSRHMCRMEWLFPTPRRNCFEKSVRMAILSAGIKAKIATIRAKFLGRPKNCRVFSQSNSGGVLEISCFCVYIRENFSESITDARPKDRPTFHKDRLLQDHQIVLGIF